MPSGAPTYLSRESQGPVMGSGNQQRVIISTALGAYVTGGVVLTLPGEVQGRDVLAVNVLTSFGFPVVADMTFSWAGNVGTGANAPKIIARVMSTGLEVANAAATGTVKLEIVYGDNG